MTAKTQTHYFQTWGELKEWAEADNMLATQMRKTAIVRAVNASNLMLMALNSIIHASDLQEAKEYAEKAMHKVQN